MFEPEGSTLANLVRTYIKTASFERVVSRSLMLSGFSNAAKSRATIAAEAEQMSYICEMALQFEVAAGLA